MLDMAMNRDSGVHVTGIRAPELRLVAKYELCVATREAGLLEFLGRLRKIGRVIDDLRDVVAVHFTHAPSSKDGAPFGHSKSLKS